MATHDEETSKENKSVKPDQEKASLGGASYSQDASTGRDAGDHEDGRNKNDKDTPDALKKNAEQKEVGWSNDEERNDMRRGKMEDGEKEAHPKEGDRRDTSLEKASGLRHDQPGGDEMRRKTGGWSESSGEENN